MKFVICFILLFSFSSVFCSDPWGWQTPSTIYNFDNSHGEGHKYGHDNERIYDKDHVNKFQHENAHESGTASGFIKGAKTDWANYQYGGEGSRAEGHSFAKSYGTSFGEGHDVGHASGKHHNHENNDGHDFSKTDGWKYSPHYEAEINEHDPWQK
uniref:Uncharacterized protein n=1 Tax=Panagrolaimus davidi TaxID=227884 RepID=A0A914QNJ5_9BILA